MAPNKKKDKSQSSGWLQCSLCKRLICLQDAELHTTSCSANHCFIQGSVLHGKIANADSILGDDGVTVTRSIRDKDNAVWLGVQTMQLCGLSIGQPCIINGTLVKRSWPLKSLPLTGIAISQRSMEELDVSKDETVTVERFLQDDRVVAEAIKLRLRECNPVFQSKDFEVFIGGYLDGKSVTKGSPLLISYFGQTCYCHVENLICRPVAEYLANHDKNSSQVHKLPNTSVTPVKNVESKYQQFCSTPTSLATSKTDGGGDTPMTPGSPSAELSDSLASLNITKETTPMASPSLTPTSSQRQKHPNLVTPVKHEIPHISSHACFAKISSLETKIYVESTKNFDEPDIDRVSDQISLIDVGGLSAQIEELRMRIQRGLQSDAASRCLLVHGPPGTGKSMLIRALTLDTGLPTTMLAGTDIWSKLFGEAESNLHKIFSTAQLRAPSIIVIDDIDVICPKRSQNSSGQQEHRIVGTLLTLIDTFCSKRNTKQPIVVLAVTSNRDGVDPALRRAGRFGCEIEIGVPNAQQRSEILQILLRQVPHTLSQDDIDTVASNAHGYVGADLLALVNEASMHAMSHRHSGGHETLTPSPLKMEDLVSAGVHIKPSALREIQLEVPHVRWTDIGGMSEVKMRLREAVELPISNPEVFKQLGIEPPRGLLMYGPPGCSKTMVARALASECKLNFLAVKGPELFNQYVGESEKAIREVFRKARSAAPSVIFFDEIDAIAGKRGSSTGGSGVDDRVLTQLLTEMDGLEFLKDVFIMAATNRPDKIDNALLRPGRFDSLVYVPLPDVTTRKEILQAKFAKMAAAEDVSLEDLVEATEGYSGAEVVQVCQEAALCALRESLDASEVRQSHFDAALIRVSPQIKPELLEIYHQFSQASIK